MKSLQITTHKTHLTNILLDIYKDSELSGALGFKGGTAAMLFYDLPRFSVDLDFDLIEEAKNVVERMTKLLGAKYMIKDSSTKYNTLFWLLSYGERTTHIKVEISTRDNPFNHYERKVFYGTQLQILASPDMVAHKLVAALERASCASRDLFDIHYFLSSPIGANINYEIIKDRTGMEVRDFYLTLSTIVQKISSTNLLNGLGELLTEPQKDWARAKLIPELVGLIERNMQTYSE
jgi:predicted nucleotidyltransferase component of viral defense system